ncbi:MAG: DUF167 domain-containing protein [Candidatus Bathyarchaeota archaeon]|nr:DUF167 domain-containing protein [Candidatus Bathyarchaeota archaeon]
MKLHEDFVKVDGKTIVVGLTRQPVKGKANKELVKKLAKHFGVPSSKVKILAGLRSKKKIVEIP